MFIMSIYIEFKQRKNNFVEIPIFYQTCKVGNSVLWIIAGFASFDIDRSARCDKLMKGLGDYIEWELLLNSPLKKEMKKRMTLQHSDPTRFALTSQRRS